MRGKTDSSKVGKSQSDSNEWGKWSMATSMKTATSSAPMNMAVIKYWGKRDEELLLPVNSSLSATLCPGLMAATTTVCASPAFPGDALWLNGKREDGDGDGGGGGRLGQCLRAVRRLAIEKGAEPGLVGAPVHVCSENNFPTAAGLASSAAGYAALVAALFQLYGLDGEEQSGVARRGSGSACRSTKGGWVVWNRGILPDGSDSVAEQIAAEDHWPEMRVLILVVNDAKKKVSSTAGMRDSVRTSALLKHRAEVCVPERIERMKRAILERDFRKFAEITMKDSNQFHAICMDTYPPFAYLNETSMAIIDAVHAYNDARGGEAIAYTFDAGPNACLFMLEDEVPHALTLVDTVFPRGKPDGEYLRGIPATASPLPPDVSAKLRLENRGSDKIRYLIHTKVGSGPVKLSDHLLDETGYPKKL